MNNRKPLVFTISVAIVVSVIFGLANASQNAAPSLPGSVSDRPSAFEVASVRIVPLNRAGFGSISPSGAEYFTARNVKLGTLITLAFGVQWYQVSVKQKLGSQLYDVTAKPWGDRGLTREQLKLPLQQLLKDRFHLSWHYETKSSKGYALVIAKGGLKIHPTKVASAQSIAALTAKGIRGQNIPMSSLASILAYPLGCPVIDKTGLKGHYDFTLDYAQDIATDSSLPSVFTALQEDLGLKLVRQKVPVKMLVIDHVDKVPTEN